MKDCREEWVRQISQAKTSLRRWPCSWCGKGTTQSTPWRSGGRAFRQRARHGQKHCGKSGVGLWREEWKASGPRGGRKGLHQTRHSQEGWRAWVLLLTQMQSHWRALSSTVAWITNFQWPPHPNAWSLWLCYCIWQKGLCRCDQVWGLEMGRLSQMSQMDPV